MTDLWARIPGRGGSTNRLFSGFPDRPVGKWNTLFTWENRQLHSDTGEGRSILQRSVNFLSASKRKRHCKEHHGGLVVILQYWREYSTVCRTDDAFLIKISYSIILPEWLQSTVQFCSDRAGDIDFCNCNWSWGRKSYLDHFSYLLALTRNTAGDSIATVSFPPAQHCNEKWADSKSLSDRKNQEHDGS